MGAYCRVINDSARVGEYFMELVVGVCRWDSEAHTLFISRLCSDAFCDPILD